jgi:glycerate kinase
MRVVIAPDSFKGVLDAQSAAEAIAAGVRRARPGAEIDLVPMADGGEGSLDVLVDAARGHRRRAPAHGPLGDEIDVTIGLINDAATAVIEMARVSGYALVPAHPRDPLRATTFGLGEAIRAVVDAQIEDVILCIGGSATIDGGAGMMQALGLSLRDAAGRPLREPVGGGMLCDIHRISWDAPPPNIENVQFTIAHDVLNPACGPSGAAAVFGPQKGADAAAVALLDRGLEHWAKILGQACGRRIRDEPGTGAAGGVALPLLALANASLVPGVDLVCQAVDLVSRMAGARLVLTGEGRIDRQSLMGKVVGAVGRMARSANVPCVAICGAAGEGADECLAVLDAFRTLDAPLDKTGDRLAEVAAQTAEEMLH